MICAARLSGGPLVCVRTDEHTTHQYAASDAPDKRHDEDESDLEGSR